MDRLDRAVLLAGVAGAVYLWRESLRRESESLRSENGSLRREIASLREARTTDDLAEEVAQLKQEMHEVARLKQEMHEEVARLKQEMREEVARRKQDCLDSRNELGILRRCLASKEIVLPEAVMRSVLH